MSDSAAAPAARQAQNEDQVASRLEQAFAAEEQVGLWIATRALLIAIAVTAIWLAVWVPPPRVFFLEANLAVLALVGLGHRYWSTRTGAPSWLPDLAIGLYMALLAFAMVGYDVLIGDLNPPQMILRSGTVVYFFLFVAIAALGASPRRILWAGIAGALAWSVAVLLILGQSGTITSAQAPTPEVYRKIYTDPQFVDIDVWTQDVIVLLLVAGTLAAGAARARRLVVREATLARERGNLARHFSPSMVDELARADDPFGGVRTQPVAVLFADVVGFTRWSETQPPAQVIRFLRELHGRLEAAVFEHHGTLDKYLGDGVMATFGTPFAQPADAANALAAARAMLAKVDGWNRERADAGEAPVRLSIGIHFGEVVLGDVGSARRLEFAVIGDVVNVASRLETLTRTLDAQMVVSDALLEALPATARAEATVDLVRAGPHSLPGRARPVAVWRLPR